MYFIRPNTMTPCVATTSAYKYPTWVSGRTYNKGDIVRDATDNADFKCRVYSYSSTTRPGAAYWYYWERLTANGSASVGPATYKSTFATSNYDAWSSGAGAYKGDRRWDTASQKEYEALVAISGANDTVRPSSAVLSQDLTIRGRWLEIGPANLFALFDDDVATTAQATTSAYVIFDVIGPAALEDSDCLAIVGVTNVATITIQRLNPANDAVLETTVYSMDYTPQTFMLKDTLVHHFTAVDDPRFKITFTATVGSPYQTIRVGKIIGGKKVSFGQTVENVNVSITDFSAKVVDETFGTYRFIKRGFSKNIAAQIMVEHGQGDQFSQFIEQARAVPTFWDFNTVPGALSRAMVYGWYKNYSCVLSGIPWDTYSLEVSGLVGN